MKMNWAYLSQKCSYYLCPCIMFKKLPILILLFFTLKTFAQADTLRSQPERRASLVRDSSMQGKQKVSPAGDSILIRDSLPDQRQVLQPAQDSIRTLSWDQDTAYRKLYRNLYPAGKNGAVFMITSIRQSKMKDDVFFMLAGVLLLVAIT